MAYSFVPQGQGWGGSMGGYGSLGMGAGLANALGVGLNLADGFRRFQNSVYLDQAQLPAAYRGYQADLADNTYRQEDALGAIHGLREDMNKRMNPGLVGQGTPPQAWQTPLAANPQQIQQAQQQQMQQAMPQGVAQMLQVGQLAPGQQTGIRALDIMRPPVDQASQPYQGPYRR